MMEQILRQDPRRRGGVGAALDRRPRMPSRERPAVRARRCDLPLRSTSFVGRDADLDGCRGLLGARLVTLAGPGRGG